MNTELQLYKKLNETKFNVPINAIAIEADEQVVMIEWESSGLYDKDGDSEEDRGPRGVPGRAADAVCGMFASTEGVEYVKSLLRGMNCFSDAAIDAVEVGDYQDEGVAYYNAAVLCTELTND